MPSAGKAWWPACQWHPVERAGKHAAVSEAPGLFVIFSKVTRDCRRLNPVENTHRDNDGKRQQSENVLLKWKPRCQVLIMAFLNKYTSH